MKNPEVISRNDYLVNSTGLLLVWFRGSTPKGARESSAISYQPTMTLALVEECYKDKVIMQRWQAFLAKTTLSQAEDSLEKVALSRQEFFAPVIQSFSDESRFKKHWDKQKWI